MSKTALLRLYDSETEEIIEIVVSEAEAQRAETDLEFATQLLAISQSQTSPNSPTTTSSPSHVPDAATPASKVGEAVTVNGFKWVHEAILLLVEEFRKEQENLVSGRVSQKKIWERIAKVLHDNGHLCITGAQCLSKFNGLKRTYKAIKDHNGKSGNSLRSWPYLALMESVLGEKPYMQPVATLSSTGTGHAGPSTTLTAVEESACTSSTPNSTRKRKAISDIAEAIVASRKLAEESREVRHQERIREKREFQENFLQMMGELINKI